MDRVKLQLVFPFITLYVLQIRLVRNNFKLIADFDLWTDRRLSFYGALLALSLEDLMDSKGEQD